MVRRIITYALFVTTILSIPNALASTPYELCNNGTKRRKTDPDIKISHEQLTTAKKISREKIIAHILDSYAQFPHVIAGLITTYLIKEKWYEQKEVCQLRQRSTLHIIFNEMNNILSANRNNLYVLKKDTPLIKETFKLPTNFYTKTYLLRSKKSLYFVLDNDRLNTNQNRHTNIYDVYHNPTEPQLIKTYNKVHALKVSQGNFLGIIREQQPTILNCETTEEWNIPTKLKARCIAFSSNNLLLAISGKSGIIQLWELLKKSRIGTIISQRKTSWQALALTSSGIVATTTHIDINMHTLATPDYATSSGSNLYHIEFSTNGQFLVALNYNQNCIEVRDGITGSLLQSLHAQNSICSLAFTSGFAVAPNSRRIVTSYVDGSLVLWKLQPTKDDDYDITQ